MSTVAEPPRGHRFVAAVRELLSRAKAADSQRTLAGEPPSCANCGRCSAQASGSADRDGQCHRCGAPLTASTDPCALELAVRRRLYERHRSGAVTRVVN